MDKNVFEAWLNLTEAAHKEGVIAISRYDHSIQFSDALSLLKIAKALGQTVITEPYRNDTYPIISSFKYNGWNAFAIYGVEER